MNSKTLLLLTLTFLLLTILATNTQPYQTATIKSITTSETLTTIKLQNSTTNLIIFSKPQNLNLFPSDTIKFRGKPSTYKTQNQIILTQLYKTNN